jgi:uncharacterized damage-inducible protein DinB
MKNELKGTVKALLIEYRRAVDELIAVIRPLGSDEIMMIRDDKTTDPNCKSVQTILSHVVYAGYGYTNFIENHLGADKQRHPREYFESAQEYVAQLSSMFDYCENFFIQHPTTELEEKDHSKKIMTNWGQQYDIEQMMEHAIVHVLKHRGQIERFTRAREYKEVFLAQQTLRPGL